MSPTRLRPDCDPTATRGVTDYCCPTPYRGGSSGRSGDLTGRAPVTPGRSRAAELARFPKRGRVAVPSRLRSRGAR